MLREAAMFTSVMFASSKSSALKLIRMRVRTSYDTKVTTGIRTRYIGAKTTLKHKQANTTDRNAVEQAFGESTFLAPRGVVMSQTRHCLDTKTALTMLEPAGCRCLSLCLHAPRI